MQKTQSNLSKVLPKLSNLDIKVREKDLGLGKARVKNANGIV